jgi:hypothetical protein
LAALDRFAAPRFLAAECAWRDNARCDAAEWGIFCNARFTARDLFGFGF